MKILKLVLEKLLKQTCEPDLCVLEELPMMRFCDDDDEPLGFLIIQG
jgi:hypothetical protein